MSQNYIKKVYSFFGECGLIVEGKANTFSNNITLTRNDVITLYDLVCSDDSPLPKNVSQINYMFCTYYFQADYFPKAIDSFYKRIFLEFEKNPDAKLTKERLYFIFNVVEFCHKYHKFDAESLKYFLAYMNKFKDTTKTYKEYVLYTLYIAMLYYELKDYQKCILACNEAIPYLEDWKRSGSSYSPILYNYLKSTSNLLIVMAEKENPKKNKASNNKQSSNPPKKKQQPENASNQSIEIEEQKYEMVSPENLIEGLIVVKGIEPYSDFINP